MAAEGGPAVDLRDEKTVRAAFFHMLVDWQGTDLQNVYEPLTTQFGYLYTMFLVILGVGIVVGLYKKWARKRRETPLPYKVLKPPANLTRPSDTSSADKSPRKRVVAVVGATGFVGSHIVKRLVRTGDYIVYALGRKFTGVAGDQIMEMADGVFQVDMMNYEGLLSAFGGVDSVIHAAAAIPTVFTSNDDLWRINVVGSENIMSAARESGVRNLVFITGLKPAENFNNKAAKIFMNALAHVEDIYVKSANNGDGDDQLQVCVLPFGQIYGLNSFYTKILKGELDRLPMNNSPTIFISVWEVTDIVIKAERKLSERSPLVVGKALPVMGQITTARQFFALPQWGVSISEMSIRTLVLLAKVNEWFATITGYAPLGADLSVAVCSFIEMDSLEEFDPKPAQEALDMGEVITLEKGIEEMRKEFEERKQDKKTD